MTRRAKRLARVLANPTGVSFAELAAAAESVGFVLDRTSGSHHIFVHARGDVPFLDLQPDKGRAKPYQVRQFALIVETFRLEAK